MNLNIFLTAICGVLLNAAAQLFIKYGTNALGAVYVSGLNIFENVFRVFINPGVLAGLVCYFFSVGIWVYVLSKVEVSVAYPLLSIGYVVNVAAAYYFFGEGLSIYKIIGVLVIVVGVFIITRS